MIVKMTTAETDQTTWKEIGYNISTGQYQSSSGFIEANHEFTEIYMQENSERKLHIWRGMAWLRNDRK